MAAIPPLDENRLHALAAALGDTNNGLTGSEIERLLQQCSIPDVQPGITKRERVYAALTSKQAKDKCANNVISFVQTALDPVRYIGKSERFSALRELANQALAFSGYTVGENGRVSNVVRAETIAEAQQRASKLRSKLLERNVHHDVLAFCRVEFLQENYFHAVFEATKSVFEKIRQKTGLTGDGADIIDLAFSVKQPLLAINSLRTETEQSEQKGFANLLKGIFGTFRNPTAHAPKVRWPINEQDALDLLSLLSYVHRRLDAAVAIS